MYITCEQYYFYVPVVIIQIILNFRTTQKLFAVEVTIAELVQTVLLAFSQGASRRNGIEVYRIINLKFIIAIFKLLIYHYLFLLRDPAGGAVKICSRTSKYDCNYPRHLVVIRIHRCSWSLKHPTHCPRAVMDLSTSYTNHTPTRWGVFHFIFTIFILFVMEDVRQILVTIYEETSGKQAPKNVVLGDAASQERDGEVKQQSEIPQLKADSLQEL